MIQNTIFSGIQLLFEEIKKNKIFDEASIGDTDERMKAQAKEQIDKTMDTFEQYIRVNFFESDEVITNSEQEKLNREYNQNLIKKLESQKLEFQQDVQRYHQNQIEMMIEKEVAAQNKILREQLESRADEGATNKQLAKIEKCNSYLKNASIQLEKTLHGFQEL